MSFEPTRLILLSTVSDDALDLYWCAPPLFIERETTGGFIARLYLWFRLLWGHGIIEPCYQYVNSPAPNRSCARRETRGLPLARQDNPLAEVIWRVSGRARFLRFIYDEDLTGRYRWCFTPWNWRWVKRIDLKEPPLTRRKKRAALARSLASIVEITPD